MNKFIILGREVDETGLEEVKRRLKGVLEAEGKGDYDTLLRHGDFHARIVDQLPGTAMLTDYRKQDQNGEWLYGLVVRFVTEYQLVPA